MPLSAYPVTTRPSARRRSARSRGWALAAAAGALLAATGCSGDGGETGTSSSPSTPGASASPTTPLPAAPTQAAAECPPGITLPAGVDPRACGPVPAEAVPFAEVDSESPGWVGYVPFALPSMNIGCSLSEYGEPSEALAECMIVDFEFAPAPVPDDCDVAWAGEYVNLDADSSVGRCAGDGTPASYALGSLKAGIPSEFPLVTLDYGEIIFVQDIACLSAEDGVTCWNGATGHGFRLSREAQLTW